MEDSKPKEHNILDSVMYNYTSDGSQGEIENRLLKETIDQLKR